MHYIFISNYFKPEIGAASNRIYNLCEYLSKENTIDVICPMPNYPQGKVSSKYKFYISYKERINKINIYRYFIYATNSSNFIKRGISMLSFSISLWLFIFRFKRIIKSDIIFIQNSPLLVSFSAIIIFKKLFKKKIILNISDLWPESALTLGAMKEGFISNIFHKIERFNYLNSDLILGQSDEIISHVSSFTSKPKFLYRNLPSKIKTEFVSKSSKIKIVYAGLLGAAQGLFEIIKKINFNNYDFQFDIYGDGIEKSMILKYIKENNISNIKFHGIISQEKLHRILPAYHFSLVPLKKYIKGAVPSKIFELAALKVPIILIADGEASDIVEKNKIGFTVSTKSILKLNDIFTKICNLDKKSYKTFIDNCQRATNDVFDFETQAHKFILFVKDEE